LPFRSAAFAVVKAADLVIAGGLPREVELSRRLEEAPTVGRAL
jgi:hypothetical protein